MSEAPHRVRLTPALRTLLARVSPNASAAHRALLLLGAHAAGYDLAAHRAEIARALAEELDEPVARAIEALLGARRAAVGQEAYGRPTNPEPATPVSAEERAVLPQTQATESDRADPFAGLGFEV
jgi:tryptophan 2,3-dioxygenase